MPYKGGVIEQPGPEHRQQQDETFLTVWGGKDMREAWGGGPLTFIASDTDAALPEGATFTGWHDGERELWIAPNVPPALYGFPADTGEPAQAVYVVSPEGVERWQRYDVYCI